MRGDLVEVDCPLCGSNQSKALFEVMDYAFACSEDRFMVRRCQECGCGFLSPRPAEDTMALYYPPEFYWSWEGGAEAMPWEEVIARRRGQLEEKARWLEGMAPGRLLDVGAQKGEFLWFMQQRGWEVEGVELDNKVPNPAGLPIHYGDFLQMDLPEMSYDCITFWAVLEHVYQPAAFIEQAARLLRPGGRLVALVTNFNSIQGRLFHADDYPRHLTLFTPASARRVLEASGLRMQTWRTDQRIFGGALNGGLVYFAKRLAGYSKDEAMREWKQVKDPELFWIKYRGRRSFMMHQISRLDRVLTLPVEKLLDRLGYGINLTFAAQK